MPVNTASAADQILSALANRRSIAPLTDSDPGLDPKGAYAINAEIHRRRLADGWRPVGRKIGFTNRTIWAEYGVDSPMWGYTYDRTVSYAPERTFRLAVDHLREPRIEPEIVLHFARQPPTGANEAEILACIDWIAHGFEIVQSVYPGWKFKAVDTMAASGLHGALVVGPPIQISALPDALNKLRTFTIQLAKEGVVQATGGGVNVLGSPLLAFAFLSQTLAGLSGSEPVGAGEIVTTGTLTPAFPVTAGETWTTKLSGIALPGLTLTFI
jgi:2-oxo-3-hexenedioate decarboxylase